MHDEQTIAWYTKRGLTPPSSVKHGVSAEEFAQHARYLQPRNWRQEGNKLIADTDMGPLINYIPTDRLFKGVDEQGLPILEKI